MLSNSVNEHVVNEFEVEKSQIIKKIAQRNEPITQEKITQVTWNDAKPLKIATLERDQTHQVERDQTHQDPADSVH